MFVFAPATVALAQVLDLDQLLEGAEEWARENLDESLLEALEQIDDERLKKFFEDAGGLLRSQWMVDLASLKEQAKLVTPLLLAHEETKPYGLWLTTRLDYFDVADAFQKAAPPPIDEPKPPAPPRRFVPSPEKQRSIWRSTLSNRPVPYSAGDQLPRLKAIFRAEKVPPSLAWLAEVESSFNPRARSPAGAVGLYQLMPATAKQYGLSLWPRDERYDPERNAVASARHLRRLRDRFKDWPLALAAYNTGEGNIQRHLNRAKASTFDEISRQLPAETQLYVPKVEATLHRREGITLASLR